LQRSLNGQYYLFLNGSEFYVMKMKSADAAMMIDDVAMKESLKKLVILTQNAETSTESHSLRVKLNEDGEIIIDHKTSETNIHGIYAAGDVADKPFKQAITGVAEGCTAAYSAFEYITKKTVQTC
ncbi:MAG: FAD-dependent oxidoreductase, partial [Patescibacteria group bacterium]